MRSTCHALGLAGKAGRNGVAGDPRAVSLGDAARRMGVRVLSVRLRGSASWCFRARSRAAAEAWSVAAPEETTAGAAFGKAGDGRSASSHAVSAADYQRCAIDRILQRCLHGPGSVCGNRSGARDECTQPETGRAKP